MKQQVLNTTPTQHGSTPPIKHTKPEITENVSAMCFICVVMALRFHMNDTTLQIKLCFALIKFTNTISSLLNRNMHSNANHCKKRGRASGAAAESPQTTSCVRAPPSAKNISLVLPASALYFGGFSWTRLSVSQSTGFAVRSVGSLGV